MGLKTHEGPAFGSSVNPIVQGAQEPVPLKGPGVGLGVGLSVGVAVEVGDKVGVGVGVGDTVGTGVAPLPHLNA